MNQSASSRWDGQPYPLYIRKLDKKSRWGHSSDELAARSEQAAIAIFPVSEEAYSLYLVESDDDLQKVVVALNLRRGHPNEQVDLIAFREDEFTDSGICILTNVLGETRCYSADRLHVDVQAADHDAFRRLCLLTMSRGRDAYRVGKAEVGTMVDHQREYGCEAFFDNAVCSCRIA